MERKAWLGCCLLALAACTSTPASQSAHPVLTFSSGSSSSAHSSSAILPSSSGTSVAHSNSGSGGSATSAQVPCNSRGDCPTPGLCHQVFCTNHTCAEEVVSPGTLMSNGVVGDCQSIMCLNATATQPVAYDLDVPEDNNPCTLDVCTNGAPANPPAPEGTACAVHGGQVCDGAGSCVQCHVDADCPPSTTECVVPRCENHQCMSRAVTPGGEAYTQVPGDCHHNVCDASGAVSTTVYDLDLPVDQDPCTLDVCTQGAPSNPYDPNAPGAQCSCVEPGLLTHGGWRALPYVASDYVMDEGHVALVANAFDARVDRLNLATNEVLNSYRLSAVATVLTWDETHRILYSGLSGANQLARVDLTSGLVSHVMNEVGTDVVGTVLDGAEAPLGHMVFLVRTTTPYDPQTLLVVDSLRGVVVNQATVEYWVRQVAFDRVHHKILLSGGQQTQRWSFSATAPLVLEEAVHNNVYSAVDFDITPDGNHLAVTGRFSGATYYGGGLDLDPTSLARSAGLWAASYPTSGRFSSDGALFGTTEWNTVRVFSVANHTEMWAHNVYRTRCWGDMTKLRFSRGGCLVHTLLGCSWDNASGILWLAAQ